MVELHRPDNPTVQLPDRHIPPRLEVICAGTGSARRHQNGSGQVAHEHKIAPSVGDEATFRLRQTIEKNWQWPADVARADYICKAEGDPVHAAQLDVVLARGLRDRIAAVHWIEGMSQRDRLLPRLGAVT